MIPSYHIDGYSYLRCPQCSYLRLIDDAPEPAVTGIYSDAYFFGQANAGYADYLSEGALLRAQGHRYGRLLQHFAQPGPLLDVGTAAGFILAGLCDYGWEGEGIDVNASMCEWARSNLKLHVTRESLERYTSDVPFSAITMVQVAAHFFDVFSAFENASMLTAKGGIWLIETWNARSLTARLMGKRWHELSPPSVRRIFTPGSLARLAKRYGMEPIAFGRPVKRILVSHAKSLLEEKARGSTVNRALALASRALPDTLVLPYPADDLFWAMFRKAN